MTVAGMKAINFLRRMEYSLSILVQQQLTGKSSFDKTTSLSDFLSDFEKSLISTDFTNFAAFPFEYARRRAELKSYVIVMSMS